MNVPSYNNWWSGAESASKSITAYVPVLSIASNNSTSVTLSYTGLPPGSTIIDWQDDSGNGDGTQTFTVGSDTGTITHNYASSTANFFEPTGDTWGAFDATPLLTTSTGTQHSTQRVLGIPINTSPVSPSTASASIWRQGSTALSNNRGIVVVQGESVQFTRSAVAGYDIGPLATTGAGVLTTSDNITGTMTTVGGYNGEVTGYYLVEGSAGTAYTYNNTEEGILASGVVSVSKARSVMQTKDSQVQSNAPMGFSLLRDWYRNYAIDNDDNVPDSGNEFQLGDLHGTNIIIAHIYFQNETHTTYYDNADAKLAVYVDGAYDPYTVKLVGVSDTSSRMVVTNQPRVLFSGLNGNAKNSTGYEYDLKITAGGSSSPNEQVVRIQTRHGTGTAPGAYLNGTSNDIVRASWADSTQMAATWSHAMRIVFPLGTDVPGSTITTGTTTDDSYVDARIPPGDLTEAPD